MRLAIVEGQVGAAFDALLDCAQYPFAQPLFLAIAPSALANTETDVRHWVILEWAATLVGLFVLVRSILRQMGRSSPPGSRSRWRRFRRSA
jgi:hypothetical protein